MYIQRSIRAAGVPHPVSETPASFVHRQAGILVITLNDVEAQFTRKRRAPLIQFAGRVKKLGE